MDFVTHLTWTPRGYDSVWLVVSRLNRDITEEYSRDMLEWNFWLYEVPLLFILDGKSQCTTYFWNLFQKTLTTFLEDILKSFVLNVIGGSWDAYLALAEIAYHKKSHYTIDGSIWRIMIGVVFLLLESLMLETLMYWDQTWYWKLGKRSVSQTKVARNSSRLKVYT